MKIMSQLIISLTVFLSGNAFAQDMAKETKTTKPSTAYKAAIDDIKSNLGMVPTMFKMYPQEGLPGAWEEMKSVQMNPNSQIPGKYKELLGLAVSAQIPCKYCVYFHKKFAALQGATEAEINETIAVSSLIRKWSTYAYGQQLDMDTFKKDVSRMISHTKTQMQNNTPAPVAMEAANITTADLALKDIQNMYGFVPNFLSEYHKPALPAAWKTLRDFQFNMNTSLPMKYKNLIGVVIGAQMPCDYCTHIDGEFAKVNGASADELKEAVLVSATVRHWSTFLNGLSMDDGKFRREVDQMVSIMKKKMGAAKTDRQAANH